MSAKAWFNLLLVLMVFQVCLIGFGVWLLVVGTTKFTLATGIVMIVANGLLLRGNLRRAPRMNPLF